MAQLRKPDLTRTGPDLLERKVENGREAAGANNISSLNGRFKSRLLEAATIALALAAPAAVAGCKSEVEIVAEPVEPAVKFDIPVLLALWSGIGEDPEGKGEILWDYGLVMDFLTTDVPLRFTIIPDNAKDKPIIRLAEPGIDFQDIWGEFEVPTKSYCVAAETAERKEPRPFTDSKAKGTIYWTSGSSGMACLSVPDFYPEEEEE